MRRPPPLTPKQVSTPRLIALNVNGGCGENVSFSLTRASQFNVYNENTHTGGSYLQSLIADRKFFISFFFHSPSSFPCQHIHFVLYVYCYPITSCVLLCPIVGSVLFFLFVPFFIQTRKFKIRSRNRSVTAQRWPLLTGSTLCSTRIASWWWATARYVWILHYQEVTSGVVGGQLAISLCELLPDFPFVILSFIFNYTFIVPRLLTPNATFDVFSTVKARLHMRFFMRFRCDFGAILRTKPAPAYPARDFSRVTLRRNTVKLAGIGKKDVFKNMW